LLGERSAGALRCAPSSMANRAVVRICRSSLAWDHWVLTIRRPPVSSIEWRAGDGAEAPGLACCVRTAGLRLFDLAGEFGVFAAVEHQPGQVKRFVQVELTGQRNNDVPGHFDADDGGRAGPADDLRDPYSCDARQRVFGGPFVPR